MARPEAKMLTIKEAVADYKMSRRWFVDRVNAGEIVGFLMSGRAGYRLDAASIRRFFETRRIR
jgi:hypothetical protein